MKISELGFSVRVRNCLRRAGITEVEQLQEMDTDDLMRIRNFGLTCLREVQQKLSDFENACRKEEAQGVPANGSYLHGYREGAEAMRSAIIREINRSARGMKGVCGATLLDACEIIKRTEV